MKRVIIFGATSAIAEAAARRYAAEGASLFLVARNADRLASVVADLRTRGAAAVDQDICDLTNVDLHPSLIDRARQALGQIDCVLIAHGTLPDQRACELDIKSTLHQIDVNYISSVSLLTHLANAMASQGSGTIIVIGSVAGDRGRQSNYVYGSAKAGLAVFVEGLRHRLWPTGVRVVLLKPGFVDTPMTAAFGKKGPLWSKPDAVAATIVNKAAKGSAVLYTPWFWRWIMLIIRFIPDFIFRRTRL